MESDSVTKAREAVIDLLREWREARQREEGQACAERELLLALAALDRAERPLAVPTEPGAYYLADGRPRVCRWPVGGADWLLADRHDSCVPDRADELTWATDPTTGEVERVPSLEEWRKLRDNLAHAETQVDIWYARAREIVAERDGARREVSAACSTSPPC